MSMRLNSVWVAFLFLTGIVVLGMSAASALPIEIDSIEELQKIGNDVAYPLNGDYILTQDIDAAATAAWNSGAGFAPLCASTPFTGHFNGQGYVIRNLFIYRPSTGSYFGLWGRTGAGSSIENLGLEYAEITGNWGVGGIVGNNGGTITNCTVSGVVKGDSSVGGIAGYSTGPVSFCHSSGFIEGMGSCGGLAGVTNCAITSCYSSCSVSGRRDYIGGLIGNAGGAIHLCYATGNVAVNNTLDGGLVGGLVGQNSATITDSYATGDVRSCKAYAGGLIGNNSGNITRCYALGSVIGDLDVGGLIGRSTTGTISQSYAAGAVTAIYQSAGGFIGHGYGGTVSNCYSTGPVVGNRYVGGFIGELRLTANKCYSTGPVQGVYMVGGFVGFTYYSTTSACFWDKTTSGQTATMVGATGLSSAQMTISSSFVSAGWDFGTVWTLREGASYPFLQGSVAPDETRTLNLSVVGNGSVNALPSGGTFDVWSPLTITATPNPGHVFAGWVGQGFGDNPFWHENPLPISSAFDIDLQAVFLPEGPIAIDSIGALQLIGNTPAYPCYWQYILSENIDASETEAWNDLQGFEPLPGFYGTLDGQEHTIVNLHINRPDEIHVGLFRTAYRGAIIRNLALENVSVRGGLRVGALLGFGVYAVVDNCYVSGYIVGKEGVGGLLGCLEGSNITNCHALCEIECSKYGAGGVVGYIGNGSTLASSSSSGTVSALSADVGDIGGLLGTSVNNCTISRCHSDATVAGFTGSGGLVGSMGDPSVITQSYATGNVNGTYYTGGLAGSGGTVNKSYATGAVVGTNYVGGLVGQLRNQNINQCYAAGSVSGTTNIGGIVGSVGTYGSVTSCFWDTNVGGPNNGYGVGLPTAQMKQRATYESSGWLFTGTPPDWMLFEGLTYPQLYGMLMPVESVESLQALAFMPSGNFYLTRDIDARGTQGWWDKSGGPGFTPIGTSSQPFNGILDGRGHRIFGLYVNRPDLDGAGLFGHIGASGVVRDLGLDNASVTGGNFTGCLVGVNGGTVERCYAQGSVSGAHEVGGLVGRNAGTIAQSYAAASVSGATVGGLVGASSGGATSSCFWDVDLSGVQTSGGGTGLATGPLQAAVTYTSSGWDFLTTWTLVEGLSYPYFRSSTSVRISSFPATLIDADSVSIGLESFVPDLFVTVGGGAYPAYHRFAAAGTVSLTVSLKQEAINQLVVSTLSATGEEFVVARITVYESAAFPSVPTAVTDLVLSPLTASLAVDASQQYLCSAAFADGTTAGITPAANWNASSGTITGAGLYTHVDGAQTVQALLHTDQGWRSSPVGSVTTMKGGPVKVDQGRVSGVVRSHYTNLGLPQGEITAYPVFTPGVSGQYGMFDSLGNYVFFLNEGIYHMEGTNPGYRSEIIQGGLLLAPGRLIYPGPPPAYSEPVYSGRVRAEQPLDYNFLLRPNDAQAPWVYYIEPPADCTVNEPGLVVTAINADKYSELSIATFTLNTVVHDVRERISTTGFYRNTWPLELGLNTMRLYSMDTEGNASERSLEVVYDPDYVPGGPPPDPDGPPSVNCVRMAITNLRDGQLVRGNAVTLLAEPLSGDLGALDAVSFEARGAGTGDAWLALDASTSAPHTISWNADSFPAGLYQLRAVAISLDGCVDATASVIDVTVSASAVHHEREEAGDHVLTAPVSAASDTIIALRNGARFARVLMPAGAVSGDDVLTAFFPDASGFAPALSAWQRDAALYLDLSLSQHVGAFLNGKRAALELGYPDADGDDLLDGAGLRVAQLKVRHLPGPAAAFEGLTGHALYRVRRCVCGETAHFSVFGLVEEADAPPLNLETAAFAPGTVGAAYTASLSASGGVAPYSWSVSAGALPPGLSINGNVLEGVPTQAGVYAFTLQVSDAQAVPYKQSAAFTLAVFAAEQPSVTVTRASGQASLTNALPLRWDIVFSAPVTGFIAADVQLAGTASSGAVCTLSGSGAAYVLEIAALAYDGALRPWIAAGAAQAGATVNRASVAEEEIWVDRRAPQLRLDTVYAGLREYGVSGSITVDALPIVFTINFDEEVADLTTDDVSFTEMLPGLAYALSGSGRQYTLLVTELSGACTVAPIIAANGAHDSSGNGNAETVYTGREVQYAPRTKATATLNQRSDQADPVNHFPIRFDIVFSEAVADFDVADVTASGTMLNPQYALSGSGANYILSVTGADSDGNIVFTIPESQDWLAATSLDNKVLYDLAPPEIAIGAPSPTRSWKGPVSFPVQYTGAAAISLSAADITLAGAPTARVTVTGTGAQQRVVTLDNISGTGLLGIRIAAGTAVDAAGNAALAQTASPDAVIELPPTVTISRASGQGALTHLLPIAFDVVFSKPVIGFAAADVVQLGDAPGAVFTLSGSGPAYTLRVVSLAGNGVVRPRIPAGACLDGAGSPNEASLGGDNSVFYDGTPPTAVISRASGQADPTNALPVAFDVIFSEPVVGLEATDFSFVGTATGITCALSGTSPVHVLHITGSGDGTIVPTLVANACQDAAGNGNLVAAGVNNSVYYDGTPPTFSALAVAPSPAGAGAVVVISFRSSEPLALLPEVQINGMLTMGSIRAALEYEYQYMVPVGEPSGPAAIAISGVDLYGNTGTLEDGAMLVIDHTRPTANFSAAPRAGMPPLEVAVTDLSAPVAGTPITDWQWDFGDGSPLVAGQTPAPHVYAAPGVYTIALTVTDAAMNSDVESKAAHIVVGGPTAAFSAAPVSGHAPLNVQFTDASDPGALPIADWQWDFGDGNVSLAQHPMHTYAVAGTYTVTLTIVTPVTQDAVSQHACIEVIPGVPPSADFAVDIAADEAPLSVQFTDASTPGSAPIEHWQWDFGDGTSGEEQHPAHVYDMPGAYTVSLTVASQAGSNTVVRQNCIIAYEAMPIGGAALLFIVTLVLVICGIILLSGNASGIVARWRMHPCARQQSKE